MMDEWLLKTKRDVKAIKKLFFIVLLIYSLINNLSHAVEIEEIRVRAGLDLFPSLLSADMDIKGKKDHNGSLLLVLLYNKDKEMAREMADYLKKVNHICDIPIRIEISDIQSLDQLDQKAPAGLFLTQPLPQGLNTVIDYGIKHHIIVFSPFEGDVERGVLGGIHISARLLPYINTLALDASKIRIKPFFLRVATQYGKE